MRKLHADEASFILHEVLNAAKKQYGDDSTATPIAIEELPHAQPWKLDFRVSFREHPDVDVAMTWDRIEELLQERQNGKSE